MDYLLLLVTQCQAGGLFGDRNLPRMFIERLIPTKFLKLGYKLIAAWLIVGALIFGAIPIIVGDMRFRSTVLHSRIDSIEFKPGHHGSPNLKLSAGWYLLSGEELKISAYIQVGDSIAKEKGSTTVVVFRRSAHGTWIRKDF